MPRIPSVMDPTPSPEFQYPRSRRTGREEGEESMSMSSQSKSRQDVGNILQFLLTYGLMGGSRIIFHSTSKSKSR